jgi:hypothetical protein
VIHLPVIGNERPAFRLRPSAGPELVAKPLERVELRGGVFAGGGGEVRLFSEQGRGPDGQPAWWLGEEGLLAIAEAAQALARVDAWPGPPDQRERARERVASRYGVEVPGKRSLPVARNKR